VKSLLARVSDKQIFHLVLRSVYRSTIRHHSKKGSPRRKESQIWAIFLYFSS